MNNMKTLAISALMIPALAACGTGYTNDGARGYGYDRDNVQGHNEYLKTNDSHMNYQHRDTHCGNTKCKMNGHKMHKKDGKTSWAPGMTMPDGGKLMMAKSMASYDDAVMMAQKNCSTSTGVNIWKKKMWDGKYVVKYTCFNR